jgi:NAD(P)-dependent dehydrogenase (short-subunit alcohol dehydrogenase family)
MQTILITGAASGLGLDLVQHYISQPDNAYAIIAIHAIPFPQEVPPSDELHTFQADITSPIELSKISEELLHRCIFVNVIIHCAGIRGLVQEVARRTKDVAAAETYEAMDQATMMRTLETNTWGTFNVIKSFLPNMATRSRSDDKGTYVQAVKHVPKVIIMSSRMGSISSNTSGGGYAYRASKAGLNAMVKSFAIDVKDVVFLTLHPGRVATGLVAWKEEGAFSISEVLPECLQVIEKMDRNWSGLFVDRWGKEIGW